MKRTFRSRPKGAGEARRDLPKILSAAVAGQSTVITRRGREIAAVVPIALAPRTQPLSLVALAGSGQGLWGAHSAKTIDRLRDEWKR